MPDNNTPWPMPKFHFNVCLDNIDISFQEVSGLDVDTQRIEYRHEDRKEFSPIKMPGIASFSNVTFKHGIFKKDNTFWKWYDAIKMNTIQRTTVVIKLLDKNGSTTMTWTLKNAWPSKITATDLKSDRAEVAIDTLEIAHEGITIANG